MFREVNWISFVRVRDSYWLAYTVLGFLITQVFGSDYDFVETRLKVCYAVIGCILPSKVACLEIGLPEIFIWQNTPLIYSVRG